MSKKKLILGLLVVVQIFAVLVFATYGWVTNNQTPEISRTDIQIMKSAGLIMSLDENGDATDTIDITQILSSSGFSFEDFVLRQASSQTGAVDSFYKRSLIDHDGIKNYEFVKANSTLNDVPPYDNSDYIAFIFFLEAEDEDRYVFIDPIIDADTKQPVLDQASTTLYEHNIYQTASYITSRYTDGDGIVREADTAKAVRISITFSPNSSETIDDPTTIFGLIPEDEVEATTKAKGLYTTTAVTSVGAINTNDLGVDVASTGTQFVRMFGDFAGGDSDSCLPITRVGGTYSNILRKGTRVMVTIRIWLEGGSSYCTDKNIVANTQFSVRIKFGSKKVTS